MDNFYEHIDDYKNGLLEGEVLASFEVAMKNDASLQLAVDNYDEAKSISEGLLEVDMLQTLASIKSGDLKETTLGEDRLPNNDDHLPSDDNHSEITGNKKKTSFFNLRSLVAAASMIGIICLAGWWMMKSNADAELKEFVMNQVWEMRPSDPDATKSIDADIAGMDNFQKGKYFFAVNDFESSAKWLELMISEEKDEKLLSTGHYWLGHAYVQLGRFEDAEKAWGESDLVEAIECMKLLN